jgi:tetratricopeptide (TPR) repeat protein
VAQEENLQKFTHEVSDFDDGVFRKTWETTNTLRDEVRRSLLFWLARLARERKSNEIKEEWVDKLSNYPELHEIQTLFQVSSTSENNHNSWIQEAFIFFSEECRKKYLPVPKLITAESITRKQVTIEISIINNSRIDRLYVTLKIIPFGNTEKSKSQLVPPIEIDVAKTSKGALFISKCAVALTFLALDDWSQGIVRKMLGLRYIDSPTVSAGAMALIAAELRLENSRAKHALFEVEKLSLEFLIYALESGQTSSETLYNLARQLLRHSLDVAIVFYSELVRTDSSYDERWYYHRDLGLIQYDLNNYQEAAKHYDKACHLKQIDSELFRFAGDAYYYQGKWTDALVYKISSVAEKIAEAGYRKFASPLFTLSKRFSELNYYSDVWLALYANRKTDFKKAILHLLSALSIRPEAPSTRLNLVMNMIFLEEGKFTESSREHMKITIFHGGPSTREQFKLRLINTKNKNQLIIEFDELFELVKKEREDWSIRRKEILKPEKFGEIMHFEFRE